MNFFKLGAALFVAAGGVLFAAKPVQAQGLRMTTDGTSVIRAGMTKQQIIPHIRPQGISVGEDRYECDIFETRDGLATVMVQRGIVTSIATESPRFMTTLGARVGTPEPTLRRLYGARLIKEVSEYGGLLYYFYSTSGNGIRFYVNEGRVISLNAGARSSIRLAEGCL
jgi:hypothetical protein